MNYKEFMTELFSKKSKGIYLIDSKEEYLKETIIDQAKDLISFPDFNYIEIKGKKSLEDIKTAIDTYPDVYKRQVCMDVAEDMMKYMISFVLENCKDEIEFFNERVDDTLIERLTKVKEAKFARITYTDVYKRQGYAKDGVAVIVDCLTDNKNRTAPDIRHIFDKNGGNLGTDGSVMFMFNRKGLIEIEKEDVYKRQHNK